MKTVKPDFYDKFKCTASHCNDTCCAGWEVDIDESTLSRYKRCDSAFGDKLRENITYSDDGTASIKLAEHDRCVFLNKNNLCDIITSCGEGYLCDICRLHPRFFEWLPDRTEAGLGLCCEEACRLLFENKEKLAFVCEEDEDTDDEGYDEYSDSERALCDELIKLREELTAIYSDNEGSIETLTEKMFKLAADKEKELFSCETHFSSYTDEELIALLEKSEPIDDEWSQYIKAVRENLSKIKATESEFENHFRCKECEYEKLFTYIMYRHFMKSFFDECISERVRFSLAAVRFIKLSDVFTFINSGDFTDEDRINNVKRFSKQIEYSDENTELLTFGD